MRRAFDLALGQGGAQIVSALIFLILARVLTPTEFGQIAVAYGISMFLSILFEFGSTSLAVRQLGTGGDQEFYEVFRARLSATIVLVIVFALLAVLVEELRLPSLVLILAVSSALARIASAPLRASQRTRVVGQVLVFEKVLVAALLAVTVYSFDVSISIFITYCVIGSFAASISARSAWPTRKFLRDLGKPRAYLVNPFRGAKHLGISSIAVGLQTLDAAVIALAAGPHIAGIFAAVGRWTQPMSLVAQAVSQSAYADMSAARSHRTAFLILRQNMLFIAAALLPLAIVFIFADFLVLLLLGEEYANSATVLRVLVAAVVFGSLNSPLTAFLQAKGHEYFTSAVLSIALPTQIFLMGLLAHISGAGASALAVLTVQAALSVTLISKVRQLMKIMK